MPDPKDKKEKPKGWNFDTVEVIIIILILTLVIGSIGPGLFRYLTTGQFSFFGFRFSYLADFFMDNIGIFRFLGFTLALSSAVGTFVLTKMGDAVWLSEKAKVFPPNMPLGFTAKGVVDTKTKIQKKWEEIVKKSESLNSSDWRLSIIEADIILDELLQKLQLPGETMGDKLKAVEKSDFTTIDMAWEAHKARNMIAHEGSDFLLNQRETRRIISLYEAVFKEFSMI